jgi:hypothetical protein
MSNPSVKVMEVDSPNLGPIHGNVDLATIEEIEIETPIDPRLVEEVTDDSQPPPLPPSSIEIEEVEAPEEKKFPSIPPDFIPSMPSVGSFGHRGAGPGMGVGPRGLGPVGARGMGGMGGMGSGPDLSKFPPDIQEMMKKMEQYRDMRPGVRTPGSLTAGETKMPPPLGPNMPHSGKPPRSENTDMKNNTDMKMAPEKNTAPEKKKVTFNVDNDASTPEKDISLQAISRDIDNIKSALSSLYVPKHFDSLMKKVGSIEENTQKAQASMNTCYNATFFIFMMFVLLCLGTVYVIWRMNYFKFLFRQNLYGRYARPKTCYACYRPWRKRARRGPMIKENFSSPELAMDHRDAPRPEVMADMTSASEASSEADIEVNVE